jgi:hypothetical protein
METEKVLTILSLVVAGVVILVFLLDAFTKFPFGRPHIALDILFILGGAFVLWQGIETYLEFR